VFEIQVQQSSSQDSVRKPGSTVVKSSVFEIQVKQSSNQDNVRNSGSTVYGRCDGSAIAAVGKEKRM